MYSSGLQACRLAVAKSELQSCYWKAKMHSCLSGNKEWWGPRLATTSKTSVLFISTMDALSHTPVNEILLVFYADKRIKETFLCFMLRLEGLLIFLKNVGVPFEWPTILRHVCKSDRSQEPIYFNELLNISLYSMETYMAQDYEVSD